MSRQPIYIDGLGLLDNHFSGIGHYILGILQGMDEVLERDRLAGKPVPQVKVIIPRDQRAKFESFGFRQIRPKLFPMSFRYMSALWHRGWLPPVDLICGRGTYVFTRFVDMRLAFSPSVLVIFDLSFEMHREYSDDKNAAFLSRGVRRSVRHSDKIITISQNARREIVDFYDLPEDKVVVATPATDPSAFYRRRKDEIDKVKRRYGIKGDYILALSNLEPRKNLEALINAYCRLPKRILSGTGLLLVGVSGWKTDKLLANIAEKVEAGYDITRPKRYVTDADLPAIISGAKMLVYPSRYEGFGMPPLEALACGVPVISADNSSLPEVVGEAGALIPSEDQETLLRTMSSYFDNLSEISSKVRDEGPARARRFSWPDSARIYLDAAEEAGR